MGAESGATFLDVTLFDVRFLDHISGFFSGITQRPVLQEKGPPGAGGPTTKKNYTRRSQALPNRIDTKHSTQRQSTQCRLPQADKWPFPGVWPLVVKLRQHRDSPFHPVLLIMLRRHWNSH